MAGNGVSLILNPALRHFCIISLSVPSDILAAGTEPFWQTAESYRSACSSEETPVSSLLQELVKTVLETCCRDPAVR